MNLLRFVVPRHSYSWVLLCADADFTQCIAGMQAIFNPPLPSSLSYLSHNSGRNLKPINYPICPCVAWRQLFNTKAGELKKKKKKARTLEWNWLLETIINCSPTSRNTVSFLSGTSAIKNKKCPNKTLISRERNVKNRVIVFLLKQLCLKNNTKYSHKQLSAVCSIQTPST